jgi:hypothetical protein
MCDAIRQNVIDGTIHYVSILEENLNGAPAPLATLEAWDAQYPLQNGYVISDAGQVYRSQVFPGFGYPSLHVIDANFNYQGVNDINVFIQALGI